MVQYRIVRMTLNDKIQWKLPKLRLTNRAKSPSDAE